MSARRSMRRWARPLHLAVLLGAMLALVRAWSPPAARAADATGGSHVRLMD